MRIFTKKTKSIFPVSVLFALILPLLSSCAGQVSRHVAHHASYQTNDTASYQKTDNIQSSYIQSGYAKIDHSQANGSDDMYKLMLDFHEFDTVNVVNHPIFYLANHKGSTQTNTTAQADLFSTLTQALLQPSYFTAEVTYSAKVKIPGVTGSMNRCSWWQMSVCFEKTLKKHKLDAKHFRVHGNKVIILIPKSHPESYMYKPQSIYFTFSDNVNAQNIPAHLHQHLYKRYGDFVSFDINKREGSHHSAFEMVVGDHILAGTLHSDILLRAKTRNMKINKVSDIKYYDKHKKRYQFTKKHPALVVKSFASSYALKPEIAKKYANAERLKASLKVTQIGKHTLKKVMFDATLKDATCRYTDKLAYSFLLLDGRVIQASIHEPHASQCKSDFYALIKDPLEKPVAYSHFVYEPGKRGGSKVTYNHWYALCADQEGKKRLRCNLQQPDSNVLQRMQDKANEVLSWYDETD